MMMMMADNRQQTKGAAEIPGRLRAIVADCRRLNSLPSLLRGGHPGSTGEKLPHHQRSLQLRPDCGRRRQKEPPVPPIAVGLTHDCDCGTGQYCSLTTQPGDTLV
jgi:hypothetical protein